MTDPRPPRTTVSFVDSYCATYKQLFSEVRSYESFLSLHLGMISDIKRKTLPEIAAVVGRENHQGLHHFLTKSPWSASELTHEIVLADSLYGESDTNFISVLNELKANFAVAIRSNHGVWLPAGQRIRYNKWRKFERVFSDGKKELRYIREIIFGKKRSVQYWQITTDIDKLPENSTWWIMTKIPGVEYSQIGNVYGLRTWVEYGLKQSKNELGWADFRLTNYCQIQKWWEVVCSAYLMVSLHSYQLGKTSGAIEEIFAENPEWDDKLGWKNLLNNLRLILEPFVCSNRIKTWLKVFPIPQLERGLLQLISLMNVFGKRLYLPPLAGDFYFSSA